MNLDSVINWSLMREPVNWIIVALMLAIGAGGLAIVFGSTQSST